MTSFQTDSAGATSTNIPAPAASADVAGVDATVDDQSHHYFPPAATIARIHTLPLVRRLLVLGRHADITTAADARPLDLLPFRPISSPGGG
ncbi:hypothetical protein HK405_008104, partial [Cladochytrium tenue]